MAGIGEAGKPNPYPKISRARETEKGDIIAVTVWNIIILVHNDLGDIDILFCSNTSTCSVVSSQPDKVQNNIIS